MKATLFLLKRYLFPHEGSLLNMALWLSVLGVAVGVMQLMVVLSVMSGFLGLFERNYTKISSQFVVIPRVRKEIDNSFSGDLLSIEGIHAATPFGLGQAMIIGEGVGGVTLEGIDVESSKSVTPWKEIWVEEPLWDVQSKNSYWIWLGVQLAKKLNIHPGDSVDVLVPSKRGRRVIPFIVTALTKFGIHEHDLRYARIELAALKEIFRTHHVEPMYKCSLAEGALLDDVVQSVNELFGENVEVRKWDELHRNVFLAVRHQRITLFYIFGIIIALAALNVVNLLIMSSYYRKRDVAILRAMGMRFGSTMSFFVAQGAMVGAAGVGLGILMGYGFCHLVERFQPSILQEKIYNVTKLPVDIQLGDVLFIGIVGFLMCVIFSFIPALGAALSRPVVVLRDE